MCIGTGAVRWYTRLRANSQVELDRKRVAQWPGHGRPRGPGRRMRAHRHAMSKQSGSAEKGTPCTRKALPAIRPMATVTIAGTRARWKWTMGGDIP